MPINIQNTQDLPATSIKGVVYGPAGWGKTVLCSTAPTPLIISAEKGLLSLRGYDVDYVEVTTIEEIGEAFLMIAEPETCQYETVCLDSVSDVAECMLAELKPQFTDKRQAYGEMADKMLKLLRALRNLSHVNVIVTAKARHIVSDIGVSSFVPSCPGQVLPEAIPYIFDLMMPIKIGKLEDGTTYRFLQTQPSLKWAAKDRSGLLDAVEEPDLSKLFYKIQMGGYTEEYEEEGYEETGELLEGVDDVEPDAQDVDS